MKFTRSVLALSFLTLSFSALACSSEASEEEEPQGQAVSEAAELVDCNYIPTSGAEENYWTKWGKNLCAYINQPSPKHNITAEVNRLIGKGKNPGKAIINLAEATAVFGYTYDYSSEVRTASSKYECKYNPFNAVLDSALSKLQANGSPAAYAQEVYRGMNIEDTKAWHAFIDANQPGMEVVLTSPMSSSCVKEVPFSSSDDPMRDKPSLRETACQQFYFDTLRKEPAKSGGYFDGNVRITVAKRSSANGGAAVFTIADVDLEAEVLFPAGSRFKVRDAAVKEVDGKTRFLVTYEQLPTRADDAMNWSTCPPTN